MNHIRIAGVIARDDDGDCQEIENELLDALLEVIERFGCGMCVSFGVETDSE